MVAYQCLRCRSTATDSEGCPACGAPPDPLGVELGQLSTQLAELDRRDLQLRTEYAGLAERRRDLQRRIGYVWAQVSQRATPTVPAGAPPGAAPAEAPRRPSPRPVPGGGVQPETSTRSVQTLLLILGGLLLGIAAVVFTAVAWATFGVVGRTVILAVVTLVALAVPIELRRRQLTATAETVAALALLLVLLDGYAAWTVNLLGVHQLPPSRYAALVFAVTAGASSAYRLVSRLAAPWVWALLAAQPVLPLLALSADTGILGYAAAYAGTAAVDLAVLATTRPAGSWTWRAPVAATLFLVNGAVAAPLAAGKLLTTHHQPSALLAAAILLATVGLGVAAAAASRRNGARQVAGSVAAVALVVVIARLVAISLPGYGLLAAAAATVAVWAAARTLPAGWRTGPVWACWATAGLVAVPAAIAALAGGGATLAASVDPAWHVDLARWRDDVDVSILGWQELVVLALLSAASWLLAPETYRRLAGHHVAVAGLGLVAFGMPSGFRLDWWSPLVVGVLAGLGLGGAGAYASGVTRAVARGLTAAVLLLYAAGASLVRPGVTAVTLLAIAVGGALIAVAANSRTTGQSRVVGGVGVTVAIASLAAAAGATGSALSWPEAAVLPAMMGAASLGLGIAVLLRVTSSRYLRYAVLGVSLATATTTVTTLFSSQPTGVYSASSGLLGVAGGMLLLPNRRNAAIGNCVTAGLPFTVALFSALPGILSPVQAYAWVLDPWHGTGDTTRSMLAPEALLFPSVWDPLTLLLITVAAGFAALGLAGPRWVLPAVVPGAVLAALVTPIAYDFPWPTLPAVALAIAVAAGLASGLLPRPQTGPLAGHAASEAAAATSGPAPEAAPAPDRRPVWALVVIGMLIWPVVGSLGIANSLATSGTTLVGLAIVTCAALIVTLAGRTTAARVTAWAIGSAGAAWFADAAGLVADLGPDRRPYGVVAVAVALLAVAAALPGTRAAEKLATELLSYAVAGFAVAVALPSPITVAIVLAGYGAMLGLSAVRPGRWRLGFGAAGCELVAWWVFLQVRDVGLVEAYTVPVAAAALLGGVLELRHRPSMNSWRAYGLALAAGFLPSLAVILGGEDFWLRRLLLGVAATIVVIVGAVRSRQAPVVIGSIAVVLVALRELAGLWELLPRWIPLAAAGLVLLALGATYEQRRRDVRRLGQALSKMT